MDIAMTTAQTKGRKQINSLSKIVVGALVGFALRC